LKEEFILRKGKIYLLSKKEKGEVCEFIKEQLREKYIRLSKLPQIVLVYFMEKKNSKKHIVQNHQYSNKWTVKNNYPLSLILDIVESIGIKKLFTKLDLR